AAARASRTTAPVRLDGRLDDAAWAAATPITAFTQRDPEEGRPASEATEVRIVYDADALYVSARLHDRGPVTAPLARRDTEGLASDWFGVMLDSRHDHRTAAGFWVNPAGVRNDAAGSDDAFDLSWNAVWEAETAVDSAGWTVEMRIPLGQLRFDPAGGGTWGLQLQRIIARRNEYAYSAFVPKSERGGVAAYGHLEGLAGVSPGQRLEVVPYTVARTERVDPGGNPFRSGAEYGASFGADLRYRLTPGLVLDATLNPDFGQVEGDPSEVNLSAFETQRAERRPFFVEGASLFEFGRGSIGPGAVNRGLFYSRRIGRRPQLGAPVDEADVPQTATILGAAKLTGRVGGWSVGVMDALTQEERALWRDESGALQRSVVEPFTHYLVGRALRESRGGQTWVGGVGTAVNRRLEGEPAAELRRAAYVGGVDFGHEFASRAWRLSGWLAASRVEGTPEAIEKAQRAPMRYFQRPDAAHLEVDTAATSLSGWGGQLQLSRQAGEHWRGDAFVSVATPGYEINDLGFQQRADARLVGGRVIYLENTPGRLFRSYRLEGFGFAFANGAGERVGNNLFLGTDWQLSNYWRVILNGAYSLAGHNDRLTRGGPLAQWPGERRVYTEVQSDGRKPLTLAAGAYYRHAERGNGGERMGWMRVGLRPSPRWSVSVSPQLTRLRSGSAYVATVDDPLAEATFGRRYVFADLDQTTLSLDARLNWTFTPSLSLQVYAQPFVSAADYGRYKELARPGALDFAVYGEEQGTIRPGAEGFVVDPDGAGPAGEFAVAEDWNRRDFNLRELRGNAVLRWEWRPGSTLFLAWQQSRDDRDEGRGTFRPGRDGSALFGAAPDNVFVLKVSYWLAP
ncbi:MAG TPA: DUF5916 domain-containing protein, partial [Longimicrobium sp.]|nr:DUF5916 domain-containing protein [Longimicrobium sp.]